MSLFVLDTDILSLLQDNDPVVVQHVVAHEQTHQVVLTAISVEEQISGWYTYLRQARTRDRVAQAYLNWFKRFKRWRNDRF